jgi:hypothetical protein
MRRISKRLVAKQIWPEAIKPTSFFIACRRQKRRCKTESRLQDTKPGHEPLPSEYILRGRRIDRSVRRRPAYSLTPPSSRTPRDPTVRSSHGGSSGPVAQRQPPAGHFLVTRTKNRPSLGAFTADPTTGDAVALQQSPAYSASPSI